MKNILIFLIGICLTGIITFLLIPRPYVVHYHANFAMYIDGKEEDFTNDAYMEEVSRCGITDDVHPEDRIHLHDNKWSLVHVHMAASTWWDLFSNLSWGIGEKYLVNPYGDIRIASGATNVIYVLNGNVISNPANEVVRSTDRLLIWYGTGSESEIREKADTLVPSDADEYNHKPDPASCSGNMYGWLGPIVEMIETWKEKLPHGHE